LFPRPPNWIFTVCFSRRRIGESITFAPCFGTGKFKDTLQCRMDNNKSDTHPLFAREIERRHKSDDPQDTTTQKLGSKLSQISAENRIKPQSVTRSQAKRINEIALPLLFRDQGVGGSNPLSPTNSFLVAIATCSMRSLKTCTLLVSACALIILSKGRIDFESPLFADWDLHSYRVMTSTKMFAVSRSAIAVTVSVFIYPAQRRSGVSCAS
jgi:hypothetical protein